MDITPTLSKIEDVNIIAWMFENNIVTERGRPFDFDRFSFMIDPYLDWSPEQATRKCSQIGWSVMTNLKLFYAGKFGIPGYGLPAANVIYTLPSDKDVSDFVPSKTNKLIENNKILQTYIKGDSGSSKDVDSITRKKIDNSFLYFKGTRSKTAALMISSDLNIHDESDRSEPLAIEQYKSRQNDSLYQGRWIFSNPSAPNMPADRFFQDSDQKHWFIKCQGCGKWQYLDWKPLTENNFSKSVNHCWVDTENAQYICSGCGIPITDENRKRGRWVKKYSDRKISGYWVNHLMCSWVPCAKIVEAAKGDKGYFNNFVLGLPYVGSDVVVNGQTIVDNIVLTDKKYERGKVAMGIDNGDIKHYVIGDTEGIWEIGKTKDWDDIKRLIAKYDPYFVVDLNPYPNMPRELTRDHRKGYASFYKEGNTSDMQLVEWGRYDAEKGSMVYPFRNRVFDALIDYIFNGKLKFFRAKAYWEEYISHWETLYQAKIVDPKTGVTTTSWATSTGMDHYAHATLYYYVALSRLMTAHGEVLAGLSLSPAQAIARDVGGVRNSPEIKLDDEGNATMVPLHKYLDLTQLKKKASGNGSVSGSM